MTAGVSPAMVTNFAPAGGREARSAETTAGGFDEALGRTGAFHGRQEAAGETGAGMQSRRGYGAHKDAAEAAADGSNTKLADSPGESGDVAGTADDETLETTAALQDADTDDGAEDDGEDQSLPVQIKAENAISALMAIVPVASRGRPDHHSGQQKSGQETNDRIDAARAAPTSQFFEQSAEAESGTTAAADAGTQAKSSSIAAGMSAASQSQPAADTERQATRTGNAGKFGPGAGKAATAADAGTAQTTAQSEAAVPSIASSSTDGNGDRADTGKREQRDSGPETRRVEPQSTAAKVSVVAQQAAPAPAAVPALGPNAAAIVAAIDTSQSWQPLASLSMPAFRSMQPMHSLKIQLHPAELGMVTANLKASGDQLSVELQVDNQDAYDRLSADSDAIVKSLRSLGYDIDRVSIQQPQAATTVTARADANAGAGSFSQDASPFQPGNSGSGSERFGGQTSGRGERGDAELGERLQTVNQDRAGGGLYI